MDDAPSQAATAQRTPAKSITPSPTPTAGPPRMTTSAASTRSATYSRPSPAGPSPKTHTDPATSTGHHHSATGTPSNPNPSAPSFKPKPIPGKGPRSRTSRRSDRVTDSVWINDPCGTAAPAFRLGGRLEPSVTKHPDTTSGADLGARAQVVTHLSQRLSRR